MCVLIKTGDLADDLDGDVKAVTPVVRSKRNRKNIHLILKGDDIDKLEELTKRVNPSTKTEVIVSSLQLFSELLKEIDSDSTFYIKRDGDTEPQEYEIFERY